MAKSNSETYRKVINSRRTPQRRDEGLTSKRTPPPPPVRPANVQRAASQQAIQQRSQSYQKWLTDLYKVYPPSQYDIVLGGKGGWDTRIYEKPPAPSSDEDQTGGGGGWGGGEAPQPKEITWSQTYSVEGAPEWWKGMTPSEWTPETEFASIVNALIPYLTVEDQRQMASYLARLFPTGFGDYNPEKTSYAPPPPPTTETTDHLKYFSAQRAENALSTLDKLKEAVGKKDDELGAGYSYMRQIIKAFKDFGGTPENAQTRRQYISMSAALDPLFAESKGEQLSAYGEIARSFARPFISTRPLIKVSKDEQGNWIFGKGNKKWY